MKKLEDMEWREIRKIDAFHDIFELIFLNKLFDSGLRGYRFDNREEAERANEKVKDVIVDLIVLLNEKVMKYFNEDIIGVYTPEIESLANEGLAVQIAQEIITDLNRNLSIELPSIPEFVLPQICQRSDANFTRILKEKKINLLGKVYNRLMKICGQQQHQISDTFNIDMESYVHMANSLNQEAIKHVRESSQEFLSSLDTALDEHFHKVEDTLNRYKIGLEQGIRSNNLNVDEREKFHRSIDALKDNVTRLEDRLNEMLGHIEAMIHK